MKVDKCTSQYVQRVDQSVCASQKQTNWCHVFHIRKTRLQSGDHQTCWCMSEFVSCDRASCQATNFRVERKPKLSELFVETTHHVVVRFRHSHQLIVQVRDQLVATLEHEV